MKPPPDDDLKHPSLTTKFLITLWQQGIKQADSLQSSLAWDYSNIFELFEGTLQLLFSESVSISFFFTQKEKHQRTSNTTSLQ